MNRLGLRLQGTALEARIERLYAELEARGLRFRPHFWLSVEWFTPDGVPGVAIPFYLAHPRLMKLERRQMLRVEGGSHAECMRILRHETGHAIDNAYGLRRRADRRRIFGGASLPYPTCYRPRPFSKDYVVHLDMWYAQSHPAEDFAETFAVWVRPGPSWRREYAGWPALKKLEYMDRLMKEIGPKRPPNRSRQRVEPISQIHTTLGRYYRQKRRRYASDEASDCDEELRRLFSDSPRHAGREAASVFLRRHRAAVRGLVARWTREHPYAVDQVLAELMQRCARLRLRRVGSERQTLTDFSILLAIQTMNKLRVGRPRIAM